MTRRPLAYTVCDCTRCGERTTFASIADAQARMLQVYLERKSTDATRFSLCYHCAQEFLMWTRNADV